MSCANDAATCQLSRCLCLPDDGLPPHASRVVGGLNVYLGITLEIHHCREESYF